MDEIRFFGTLVLFVLLILGTIIAIVGSIWYFSEKKADMDMARTIQCKEVGGVITFENYQYICK